MLINWWIVKRLSPLQFFLKCSLFQFLKTNQFFPHMNFLMLPNRSAEMETFIYLSGRVSAYQKKKKKRRQCIIGALPTTHINTHPLCFGIHVWNCLHDSRGSLEAGCGSWNWINFKTSPHMVTTSSLRAMGQFWTTAEFKRPHTFLPA